MNVAAASAPAAPRRGHFIRFLGYVKPYKWLIVLASIGGVVKFTAPLLVIRATGYMIDQVFLNTRVSSTLRLHQLLWITLGLIFFFIIFYAPCVYIRHYLAGKAGHRSVFDLRCELYHRILRLSASFFSRTQSGSIVSRVMSDTLLAQNLVGAALTNVWMDSVSIFVILYLMVRKDVGSTLVAIAILPIYLYFFKKFGRRIKESTLQVQEEIAQISGNVQEKISGSRVVHAFNQEKREAERFNQDSDRLFSTAMGTNALQSINIATTQTLLTIAPLLVTLYMGWRIIEGRLTIGAFYEIGMYLTQFYQPLQRFSELNVIFANSMAALERIFEIMDMKPEIVNAPQAIHLDHVEGLVEFDRVTFGYEPDNPILRDITLSAKPGQRVALVGQSGSGKSTLISLILRFYDVDSGAVRLDGHNLRTLKLDTLRRCIGLVQQEPMLFTGTIRENILYGRPRATEQELTQACQAANALSFIQQLPRGFDTEVGERGVYLSGGQKQRLTIARAFLLNPRILILDEPTSALDADSERLIQEALARLMEGRTTFIIAHRLSTITSANQILVLDHGRIVERGTHRELLEHSGFYAQLYEKQFSSAHESMEFLRVLKAG